MASPSFPEEDGAVNKKTLSGLPPWLRTLLKRMDEEIVLRGFTRETRSTGPSPSSSIRRGSE